MLKVTDINPGCGGMLLGFTQSGRFATANYTPHSHDEERTCRANLTEAGASADVLVGSFARGGLDWELGWEHVANQLHIYEPSMLLFELPKNEYAVPWNFKLYHTEAYVLNAVDYHVPQHRKRTWLVGARNDLVYPNHRIGVPDAKSWPFNVSETIGDLPLEPDTQNWRKDDCHSGRQLHAAKVISPETFKRYDPVPPGGNVFDMPFHLRAPKWQKDEPENTEAFGRMLWDDPSPEILPVLNPEKGRFLHPHWRGLGKSANQNRVLTLLECARLQTFPDDYKFYGSKVSVAKQIGTATPPKQASLWAHFLADLLED